MNWKLGLMIRIHFIRMKCGELRGACGAAVNLSSRARLRNCRAEQPLNCFAAGFFRFAGICAVLRDYVG